MKMNITLSLEINTTAWWQAFGTVTERETRADVRSYVLNQIQGSAAATEDGAILSVRLK